MKVLVPLGMLITAIFGMALGSEQQQGYEIAVAGCIIGLVIAWTGQKLESIKRKRTWKSCNSYKFK